MKTFIINLESSIERRKHILSETRKFQLDVEIIQAVDGSTLSEEQIAKMCDLAALKQFPTWLTRGAIGCALSHLEVYRRMLTNNIDVALVLEDDAVLLPNFSQVLQSLEPHLVGRAVALLHYTSSTPLQLNRYNCTDIVDSYQLMQPLDLSRLGSACGYVLTQDAAQSLANFILPVRVASDTWHYFASENVLDSIFCVYPRVMDVSGAKSVLSGMSQSIWRAHTTHFIDSYKIPPFYQLLKFLRQRSFRHRQQVDVVDIPIPEN